MKFFDVAIDAPLWNPLTYGVSDEELLEKIHLGLPVSVPLGRRKAAGVILGECKKVSEDFTIKNIYGIDGDKPVLPTAYMRWAQWVSNYYVHPLGQVLKLAFPPLKKNIKPRRSKKTSLTPAVTHKKAPQLTGEQSTCIKDISETPGFFTHLVFGVTGSGKTEVYLHLLEKVLSENKQGLVLVPEIALTPQLIARFSERFSDQVAVLHSQLTEREKTDQWWSVVEGKKNILIGARSALFCPLPRLGLIVVDEEHEPSYKQEEKLRYNGRDAAISLGKFSNCPVVLGSATPSMESWNNATEGKYKLHTMTRRVADRALPNIEVIDLKQERQGRKEQSNEEDFLPFWLSQKLYEEIEQTLSKKEQVALFLNRRGIAQSVLCQSCGYVHECSNCAISLTLHGKNHLVCHYCDYTQTLKEDCPSCPDGLMISLGIGTEQVESDIKKLFPQARVSRADRDEIQSRESLESLITQMEEKSIDVLVGTQMIAKGLDFPGLTLVGLILADIGFNLPDFRCSERSFQLLTQVSGRSGRHIESGGKVIIQTYNPEHMSLVHAQRADYQGFMAEEASNRKELLYPPFGKLACLKILASKPGLGEDLCETLLRRCEALKSKNPLYQGIVLLGPAQAPLFKLRGKFRYHMILKSPQSGVLSAFCRQIIADARWVPSGSKVQVDIDPLHLL